MLVSIPFVLGNGATFLLDQPATWRSIILGVCSIALWTLIGMGIGILIKNMLVALVVGVLLGFLVEPIVSVVFFLKRWDQLLNLMPSGATNAMLEITSPVLFAGHNPAPWWLAALVLAAWCLLPASPACCPRHVATLPEPALHRSCGLHRLQPVQTAGRRVGFRRGGGYCGGGISSGGQARWGAGLDSAAWLEWLST